MSETLDYRDHRADKDAWARELGVSRAAIDVYLASDVARGGRSDRRHAGRGRRTVPVTRRGRRRHDPISLLQ